MLLFFIPASFFHLTRSESERGGKKKTSQRDFYTSPMGLISFGRLFAISTRVITSKWSLIYVQQHYSKATSSITPKEMKLKNIFTVFFSRQCRSRRPANVDDCENYDSTSNSSCFSTAILCLRLPFDNDTKHLGGGEVCHLSQARYGGAFSWCISLAFHINEKT